MAELEPLGISSQLAARYVTSGWLVRIGHGVFAFPIDPVTPLGVARFLQTRVDGLHVGGKSALAAYGVRHSLSSTEPLVLWGKSRFVLPEWIVSRSLARYASGRIFDPSVDSAMEDPTISTPPGFQFGVRVSTPERAVLEMLYEVGTNQGLEEARDLFEEVRNLRFGIMGSLLAKCRSVKAVRLFLTWSRDAKLLDVDLLIKQYRPRVGSESRWMSRLRDGTLLSLKPYG